MSGIRGKPRDMYRYRYGQRVPLAAKITVPKRSADRLAPVYIDPQTARRVRLAEQLAAAQNLQALPRPLKPPARRTAP